MLSNMDLRVHMDAKSAQLKNKNKSELFWAPFMHKRLQNNNNNNNYDKCVWKTPDGTT